MKIYKNYYYDPLTLDLAVIQKEAEEAAKGNTRWNEKPKHVTIHHHKRNDSCAGRKHEYFKPEEKEK